MVDGAFKSAQRQASPSQAFIESQAALDSIRAEASPWRTFSSTAEPVAGTTAPDAKTGSDDTKPLASTAPKAPIDTIDNSLKHLTAVAFTSMGHGLTEPLIGTAQLAEQLANAMTKNTPGINKVFFNPDELSPSKQPPSKQPEIQKYSGEWYVKNVFENIGKLPWYILASKVMERVPGFKVGEGVLSERQLLGMNVKTAAASGFLLGVAAPTDVSRDTTLTSSLAERGLQGTIGAGQMALMTVGTAFVGKGVAASEKLIANGGTAAAEQTWARASLANEQTLLAKASTGTLRFVKNGAVASIGSIPAGLIAGYANAKAHGTEFDARESVVATMTVGFGLGGFGRGARGEKGAAKSNGAGDLSPVEGLDERRATASDATTSSANNRADTPSADGLHKSRSSASDAEPPSSGMAELSQASVPAKDTPTVRTEKLPTGKTIEYQTYSDGTVVEIHTPGSIAGDPSSKFTTKPDGTTILENSLGVYTERPDGSWTLVNSHRTLTMDADGFGTEIESPVELVRRNWHKMSVPEKVTFLNNLDATTNGGNAVGEVVEKALFSGLEPEVHKAAIANIAKITDPKEQSQVWDSAWGNYPEYRQQLFDLIPKLDKTVQTRVMRGRGSAFGSMSDAVVTRSKISDLLEVLISKQEPSTTDGGNQAVESYLQMISKMPEPTRQSIFRALDPLMRSTTAIAPRDAALEPLVTRIKTGLEASDPEITSIFGDFWHRELNNPITKMSPAVVSREGVPELAPTRTDVAERLSEFKEIFAQPKDWEAATQRFLQENPELEIQQAVYKWAAEQGDNSIKRLVDLTISDARLRQTYHDLMKDLLPKSGDYVEAANAPNELMARAKRQGLSDDQVRVTMQNVIQLLEIGKRYSDAGEPIGKEFQMAAIQTMNQAANPLAITQGPHPTCSVAALETSVYIHAPEEASRLVSEVLRTGKFVTMDGTTIVIDNQSLEPEVIGPAKKNGSPRSALDPTKTKFAPAEDARGFRSYASQIFQNTAANIYWQRQSKTPPLKTPTGTIVQPNVPMGSMRYEMRKVPDATTGVMAMKDQVVDYPGGTRRVLGNSPMILTGNETIDMGRQIGGERTTPNLIGRKNPILASKASFEDYIKHLPPEKFPVIVTVDSNTLVSTEAAKSLNHDISILQSPDGKYYIHNTWRPFSDIHAPGRWINNTLSFDQLAASMGLK